MPHFEARPLHGMLQRRRICSIFTRPPPLVRSSRQNLRNRYSLSPRRPILTVPCGANTADRMCLRERRATGRASAARGAGKLFPATPRSAPDPAPAFDSWEIDEESATSTGSCTAQGDRAAAAHGRTAADAPLRSAAHRPGRLARAGTKIGQAPQTANSRPRPGLAGPDLARLAPGHDEPSLRRKLCWLGP